jgi:hypothetical protein
VYHKVLAGWFPTTEHGSFSIPKWDGKQIVQEKTYSFEITNQHIYARLLAGDISTLVLIAYCLKQPTSTFFSCPR